MVFTHFSYSYVPLAGGIGSKENHDTANRGYRKQQATGANAFPFPSIRNS